MITGREVRERIAKSNDLSKTFADILSQLAEDNSALKQELVAVAQLVDQNTDIVLSMTNVVGAHSNALQTIQRMRGLNDTVQSEEPT